MQIIIVGRGHGGTRVISQTLAESGIYTGTVNGAGDLVPAEQMYKAVKLFGSFVKRKDDDWDFSTAMDAPVPDAYRDCLREYLRCFEGHDTYGWKLPETVLALPWLVQVFPDAYFIHWVRDGRDSILQWHGTIDLALYKVVYDQGDDLYTQGAVSWDYHEELTAQTPKPKHWIKVRFEDFVEHQNRELQRLHDYLGRPLNAIPVNRPPVRRYLNHDLTALMPILERHLISNGYPVAERVPIDA